MKIIVQSQVFYPDHSGIAIYASDFAFYAASLGHNVNVISSFPFYPKWKKRKEDRKKLFRKDRIENVNIYRGYTFVPSKPTTLKRLVQEFFLIIFSSINYFRIGKPDVIVVFTTPVSFGVLGLIFKYIFRCKLVINVQDFQVEAATSLNMVSGGFLSRILSKLEYFSYKGSDLVSSISDSMIKLLLYKKVSANKIVLWPNWIEKSNEKDCFSNTEGFKSKYNISDSKKIIGYAGNIGLKQGLNILIDAANAFKLRKDIAFLIIGEGSALGDLKRYALDMDCENIIFLPFLSTSEYNDFLNDAYLIFISQVKTDFDIYFPSKLLSIMNKGKAILLSADKDSELYKVLNDNNVAFTTQYGDIQALTKVIDQATHNINLKEEIELSAKKFVRKYEREEVLNDILKKMEKLL